MSGVLVVDAVPHSEFPGCPRAVSKRISGSGATRERGARFSTHNRFAVTPPDANATVVWRDRFDLNYEPVSTLDPFCLVIAY